MKGLRLWTAAMVFCAISCPLPGCRKPRSTGKTTTGDNQPAAADRQPHQPVSDQPDVTQRELQFRIAPGRPGGPCSFRIGALDVARYTTQLTAEGPQTGRERNDPYQWFRLVDHRPPSEVVLASRQESKYILLCNQPGRCMKQGEPPRWRIARAYPWRDPDGDLGVRYEFDNYGGALFTKLCNDHDGGYFCLLVGDTAYGVVAIKGKGNRREGMVENVGTPQDARRLIQALMAR